MRKHHHKHKNGAGVCSFHLCDKKGIELYRCSYCDKYFCEEHLNPKPPGMPRFKSTKPKDLLFMEEYHKPGGHPCPSFVEFWEANEKKKREAYIKALDEMKENRKQSEPLLFKGAKRVFGPELKHIEKTVHSLLPKHRVELREPIYNFFKKLRSFLRRFVFYLRYLFNGFFKIPIDSIILLFWLILSKIINTIFLEIGYSIEPWGFLSFLLFYAILFFFFPYMIYKFVKESPKDLWKKVFYFAGGILAVYTIYLAIMYLLPILPAGNTQMDYTVPAAFKTVKITLNDYQYLFYSSLNKGYFVDWISQISFFDNYIFKKNVYREIIDDLKSDNPKISDDQLVLGVTSLVQGLDYDYSKLNSVSFQIKFPYETLYTKKGVCMEKTLLLLTFLRELNYNVAILTFYGADHAAVGIKCKHPNYEEFCYIETTNFFEIGYIPAEIREYSPSITRFGGLKTYNN